MDVSSQTQRPHPLFWKAVEEFNQQAFFECHETLEDIWREESPGETKNFYQGLIQISVGFYHLLQKNLQGALSVLNRGLQRLSEILNKEPFSSWCNLSTFYQECTQYVEALQRQEALDLSGLKIPQIGIQDVKGLAPDPIQKEGGTIRIS